jgi:lysozyme family protein
MSFDITLDYTLREEGGFGNNPSDRGGPTNFGVTQGTYDLYRDSIDAPRRSVRLIKRTEMVGIYHVNYWRDASCHKFCVEQPDLALIHFDTAVNCGVGIAIRFLQSVAKVKIDGKIGPITLAAVKACDLKAAGKEYLYLRYQRYLDIIQNNPSQKVFKNNWLSRTNRLADRIGVEL